MDIGQEAWCVICNLSLYVSGMLADMPHCPSFQAVDGFESKWAPDPIIQEKLENGLCLRASKEELRSVDTWILTSKFHSDLCPPETKAHEDMLF